MSAIFTYRLLSLDIIFLTYFSKSIKPALKGTTAKQGLSIYHYLEIPTFFTRNGPFSQDYRI